MEGYSKQLQIESYEMGIYVRGESHATAKFRKQPIKQKTSQPNYAESFPSTFAGEFHASTINTIQYQLSQQKREKIKIWQDNNKQARRGCAGGLGHISQPSKRPNRCSLYMSLNNPPIGIHFPLFKNHSFTLRNKNNSRTLTYTHFKIFDIR